MKKHYEVLWYDTNGENPQSKDFATRKQALAFYEKHKADTDKTGWWVTKRDEDWNVIEDIIY